MDKNKILNFYYGIGGSLVPKKGRSKIPAVKGWNVDKISKTDFKNQWFHSANNWALLIPDGFLVVDVEAHKGGLDQMREIKKSFGIDLLKTFHTYTGRGGVHALYKIPKGQRAIKGFLKQYDAIEIKTPGEMVTVPPSISEKGKAYELGKLSPVKTNIKQAPKKAAGLFFESETREKADDVVRPAETSRADLGTLRECLSAIPPEEFRDYHEWVKILFAAWECSGGSQAGLDEFIAWSSRDPEYKDASKKIATLWKKVKDLRGPGDELITRKTLIYTAIKYGAKIEANTDRLVVEILDSHFQFMSIKETGAELVKYLRPGQDVFKESEKRQVGSEDWVLITNGVLSVIMGTIHRVGGIFRENFATMKIKENLERNKISIFKKAYDALPHKDIKKISEVEALREIYFKCLTHEDPELAEKNFERFVKYFIGMVRLQLEEFDDPAISQSQVCLCLHSEQQGLGKSTFARLISIVPDMIYPLSLKMIRDNEVKIALARASIALIDDYQPSGMKELNFLNEIITQNKILARPKYGRTEETFSRRAAFILTTNYEQIINDPTGSRRWLVLSLVGMNLNRIRKLITDAHAEALALARAGVRHYENLKEIAEIEDLNASFSGVETVDHILINHFKIDKSMEENEYISATDLIKKVNRAYGRGTLRDVRTVGITLKRVFKGVDARRVSVDRERLRVYNLREIKPLDERASNFVMESEEVQK